MSWSVRLCYTWRTGCDRTNAFSPSIRLLHVDGLLSLRLEADGNIGLCRTYFGKLLWSTRTTGKGVNRGKMQADDRFVALSTQNAECWSVGNLRLPGANLRLRDDGVPALLDGSRGFRLGLEN